VQLDGCRTAGMEANPIQPEQIESWTRLHRIFDAQLVEDIWRVVHLVDLHRMTAMREASNQNDKPKANANPSHRNRLT